MTNPQPNPLKGARVLIVEDEFFLADDLARAFRAAGGEPVGPVGTIGEAEDLLTQGKVDAAVVDLNLRGMMAFDFLERVAAARLPCLIVSGYGPAEVPQSMRGLPRLEKPVSPATVVDCLAGELSRAN